ncbi:MAG: hypothetical protein L0Z62_36725 [Gemmataceae bacterium]|nr:hypothetical protein [Gemmataceae bacterium]
MSSRHEAEVVLDELNRLPAPDEAPPKGFSTGGPNAPYLHFLRRRVQAIRADNLLLRHQIEQLRAENARLAQHAQWLREQAAAHHMRCQERIDELAHARQEYLEEVRQVKTSRAWRLANWLRTLGRRVKRLCGRRSGGT